MDKGKDLTETEKSNILLLKNLKLSNREIAMQLNRSKDVVNVFFQILKITVLKVKNKIGLKQ